MQYAHEVMDRQPLKVRPGMDIRELADTLREARADGACVVDEEERLIGVVTSMDLLYQERPVHLPSLFVFLDSLPIGPGRAHREELEKVTGGTVGEIMSRDPVTVDWNAELSIAARTMVDRHITVLPVLRDGRLVGALTKRGVLDALFGPMDEAAQA